MTVTFNQEVKKELCRLEVRPPCCEQALLYAMLVFSRTFPEEEAVFTTESRTAANAFAQRLTGMTGTFSTVRTDFRRLKEEAPRYTLCVEDPGSAGAAGGPGFRCGSRRWCRRIWKRIAAPGPSFGGFFCCTAL